jgi:hypothetical protein
MAGDGVKGHESSRLLVRHLFVVMNGNPTIGDDRNNAGHYHRFCV